MKNVSIFLENPIQVNDYPVNNRKKRTLAYTKESDNILTLDIETSSAWINENGDMIPYIPGRKDKYWNKLECYCLPYIWQFSYDSEIYYGREFRDFEKVLTKLPSDTHFIIWVHNLGYEFEFLNDFLDFESVFARQAHHPIKAIPAKYPNIEFRCSYTLTRLSIDSWGKTLGFPKLHSLDYVNLRTPKTELTEQELAYCARDCEVVYQGIFKYREKYDHIERIPLTQTGEVRRVLKNRLKKNDSYMRKMIKLLPWSAEFYGILKKTFAGGYTHANAINANYTHTAEEMGHPGYAFDFTSSYPFVMCSEKFPMTPFYEDEYDETKTDVKAYLLYIHFENIEAITFNHYISESKCDDLEYYDDSIDYDNGRVVRAKSLSMWLTEQDFDIIKRTYKIGSYAIMRCYSSIKAYLDRTIIDYILELYENKTRYKDVEGWEDIYAQSKQFINSLFGMMVTDMIMDQILFENGQWIEEKREKKDVEDYIQELRTKNKGRTFLCYAHGIWITAYARHNLWDCILAPGVDEDVIYCDTDSLKLREFHDWTDYNNKVDEKLKKMCEKRDIDFMRTRPKDPKGIEHPLGYFSREDDWLEFKTLGAKRYVYRSAKDGKLHLTVSGINKEAVICLDNDIENFNENTVFDKDRTQPKLDKNGNPEVDEAGAIIYEGVKKQYLIHLKDMKPVVWNLGKEDEYVSDWKCGIAMRPTGYDMSITSEYLMLIENLKTTLECMESYDCIY